MATSCFLEKKEPLKTLNNGSRFVRCVSYSSASTPCSSNRKSAVELLQETKSHYVKTESVLDAKQQLKNCDHFRVTSGSNLDLLFRNRSHGSAILRPSKSFKEYSQISSTAYTQKIFNGAPQIPPRSIPQSLPVLSKTISKVPEMSVHSPYKSSFLSYHSLSSMPCRSTDFLLNMSNHTIHKSVPDLSLLKESSYKNSIHSEIRSAKSLDGREAPEVARFFDTMGMPDGDFRELVQIPSENSSPVFFDNGSSSRVESLSSVWNESFSENMSKDIAHTHVVLRQKDVKQRDKKETSIVERNARIVKWLFECRKSLSPNTL